MADLSRYFDKAEKLLQRGKQESALEVYKAALLEDPANVKAREVTAELALALGQSQQAATLLQGLLSEAMNSADVDRSVTLYKKLVRITRPNPELTCRYASLIVLSYKREALEAYDSAARFYQANAQLLDALSTVERMAVVDPRPEYLRRLADLAEMTGDRKKASHTFVNLAVTLTKAGFDADEAYQKAYDCDESNNAARLGLGRCFMNKGQYEEALQMLKPLACYPSAPFEAREPYTEALLKSGRTVEAADNVWEIFERSPQQHAETIVKVVGALIDAGYEERATTLANRMDAFQRKVGKRREFLEQMREVAKSHTGSICFTSFMAELYNSCNHEADYCATLGQLFDLYYASDDFARAASSLERAVEVDSYEAAHGKRLEKLRGKIDNNRVNEIAARIGGGAAKPEHGVSQRDDSETTVLEDLVLQAEIFLQYSMRPKAQERLDRICKLFPHEEETNERVRDLYLNAGYIPRYDSPSAQPVPAAVAQIPSASVALSGNDDLKRSAEVNRNIARQANVKAVLFTAVNDIGRAWQASRCTAGLCTPGKPPSAALEYCAPKTPQSDVTAVVKILMGLQALCSKHGGPFVVNDVNDDPELEPLRNVLFSLGVRSLLAIPLLDRDQPVGLMILEQCDSTRAWRDSEVSVLGGIADQMVMAVNNARLRSLMKTLAVTDEKSGLLKRSSYFDVVLSEAARSAQQKSPFSIVLFHFGKPSVLAREIGEAGVEQMMEEAGKAITSHIRQTDVALRYGQTEIALMLSDTREDQALSAVEKLRRVFSSIRVPGKNAPPTVWAGVAEALLMNGFDAVDTVTEVVNRVESALNIARSQPGGAVHAIAAATGVEQVS